MRSNFIASGSLSVSHLSDPELVAALRTGQVEALGNLYDRHASLVYSLALRILMNPQEAEDLTQEIFLTLWRRDSYNPARGSLRSFLMTMTRSRCIDKIRTRGSQTRFLQRWQGVAKTEGAIASPLEQASLQERSQRVKTALAQLPEVERQILEIAYFEGLSQSEIAKRLAMPLGTVKTRCRQGLLKLRQSLQDLIL